MLHMPQLARSVVLSLQPLGHAICPAPHAATHRPLLHRLPAAQAVPHAPQFFESVLVSTHLPLQSVQGTGAAPTHAGWTG